MRIAFFWPHANTVYQTIPLSLGLLHWNIRDLGHETRMFNLPLEGWHAESPEFHSAVREFKPDLICASAWAVSFASTVEAIRLCRQLVPGVRVLLGGNYPTLQTDEAFDAGCFDWILRGECELVFRDFVKLLAAGDEGSLERLPGFYTRKPDGRVVRNKNPFVDDLDSTGRVDWEFIELERSLERGYLRTLLGPARKVAFFATRGCEFACHFCTAPLVNGTKLRHWSTGFITREIRHLYERYGIRQICFMDDNATQDRAFFKDLCRAIVAMGLRDLELDLYRGARLENLDEEMLRLMKAAGFTIVTIAPETGSDRVRRLMNKDMDRADVIRAAKMIRDAGLSVQGYFIVGYPGERAEERRESYRFIDELRLDVFSLHKYMALPGTATFKKLVKIGKIDRHHTDDSHLIGEALPNYNDDDPKVIDLEIFLTYARFYARKPWKIRHLMREASAGGLWRSFSGTAKAAALSVLGLNDPNAPLPAIREPM
jgi:radical SAM superfamily enzyme YgiQ (UPF0313 family)